MLCLFCLFCSRAASSRRAHFARIVCIFIARAVQIALNTHTQHTHEASRRQNALTKPNATHTIYVYMCCMYRDVHIRTTTPPTRLNTHTHTQTHDAHMHRHTGRMSAGPLDLPGARRMCVCACVRECECAYPSDVRTPHTARSRVKRRR